MEKGLNEKKNDLITRAEEVLNKAKEEKRELTEAEAEEFKGKIEKQYPELMKTCTLKVKKVK